MRPENCDCKKLEIVFQEVCVNHLQVQTPAVLLNVTNIVSLACPEKLHLLQSMQQLQSGCLCYSRLTGELTP